jgi:hypothetical protein
LSATAIALLAAHGETTGLAAGHPLNATEPSQAELLLSQLQETLASLPWWLQVLVFAVILVAVAPWVRDRYR